MKKVFAVLLAIGLALCLASIAFARDVHVRGYYRSNGTYVQPHTRTAPNNSTYDNYSTKGNTNPYTGQRGYQNPSPSYGSGTLGNPYGTTRRRSNGSNRSLLGN